MQGNDLSPQQGKACVGFCCHTGRKDYEYDGVGRNERLRAGEAATINLTNGIRNPHVSYCKRQLFFILATKRKHRYTNAN
jgi:hypothetical protein